MTEIEIGRAKRARPAYSLDDIAIVPSRRTRDPEAVSVAWQIDAYRFDERDPDRDGFVVSLLKGGMRSVTGLLGRRNPGRASYTTPTATIGIRGTHFGALVCNNDCANVPTPTGAPPGNGLHVDVADGRIVVTSAAGALEFSVGQFGYVASPGVVPVSIPASQGIRASLPAQAIIASISGGGGVGKAGELECVIR